MKRAARRFRQWILGSSSTLVLVLPTLAMGAWTYAYFASAYETNIAGIALDFSYDAPGGRYRVSAESVALDIDRRTATGYNVSLRDAAGRVILRARKAVVRQRPGGAVDIRLNDGAGRIERLPSGKFNVELLAPKGPATGPENAFNLIADRFEVTYQDLSDPKSPPLPITLTKIGASGIGDDIRLSAVVSTPGMSNVPFKLETTDSRFFDLTATLKDANPRRLLLATAPLLPREVRQLSWEDLRLSGPLRVIGQTTGDTHAFGSMAVEGKAVSFGEWLVRRTLSARIQLQGKRLTGPVALKGDGIALDTDSLTVDWSSGVAVTGKGRLAVKGLKSLENAYQRLLPKGTSVNQASFEGEFGWKDRVWWAKGQAAAKAVTTQGRTASGLVAQVYVRPEGVTFNDAQAQFEGIPLRAAGEWLTAKNALNAVVTAQDVRLESLRKYGMPKELSGRGRVTALLSGPIANLQISASSRGSAVYRSKQLAEPLRTDYSILVSGSPKQVEIQRGVLSGPQGGVSITGKFSPEKNSAQLAFRAVQVPLGLFQKDAKGTSYVVGALSGPLSNPRISFEAQLVQAGQGETLIPIVLAKGSYRDGKLDVRDLLAQSGFSAAEGRVLWDTKSDVIEGTFSSKGIQLAEWDLEDLVGNVAVREGRIGGTLSKPIFSAKVSADELWVQGTAAKEFSALVAGTTDEIKISDAKTEITYLDQSGTVTGSGVVRPKTRSGQAEMVWANLPLGSLPAAGADYTLDGTTEGSGSVFFAEGKLTKGSANVALNNVRVNSEEYGNGTIAMTLSGQKANVQGSLGNLDRYVLFDNAAHDLETGVGEAQLTAFNVRMEKVTALARPQMRDMDAEARRLVADLGGNIGGTARLAWQPDNFDFAIPDGTITGLLVGDTRAGDVQFAAKKAGSRIDLEKLLWEAAINGADQPAMRLSAQASLQADGSLTGDAELNNFPMSFVSAIRPEIQPISVSINHASLALSGTDKEPLLEGSARLVAELREDAALETPPSVDLFDLLVNKNGLTSQGQFQAAGFTGPLSARIPFDSLKEGGLETFEIRANANPRKLMDFADALPQLDESLSSGSIEGNFSAQGTRDTFQLGGILSLRAEQLAFRNTKTQLKNVAATLRLTESEFGLEMSSISSMGGSLVASVTAPYEQDFSRTLEEWLNETTITGSILTDAFAIDEGDVRNANQATIALGSSRVDVSGTLASPVFAGNVVFNSITADLPSFAPTDGAVPELLSNPRFDLTFRAQRPATIRSLGSSLRMGGEGRLTGSFLQPSVDSRLQLRGGMLRLPNARVQLDEGGRADVLIRTEPDGTTRVSVPINLTGRTSVTARRPGNRFERYDLTLDIRGDLTDPTQGLTITGTSEPGDLTQQEILAIVGQQELLETLAGLASDTRNNEVQNLLLSVALPSLIDPVTQSLADALSLDSIAIEYNPFEGPTIFAAKSLGRRFTLYARRVIPVASTLEEKTEFKLVYRLPGRDPFLSRSRLVLANETGRGWRLGFEYFYRF